MSRREFPAKIKLAAWERCGGYCEQCTAKLYPGKFIYDHTIPDACGGEPTIGNVSVLCGACNRTKTDQQDIPRIAKSRRIRRKHISIRKPTRFRGWRRMNGEIVYADRRR